MKLLFSDSLAENYAAVWALHDLGVYNICDTPVEPDMLGRLFIFLRYSEDAEMRRLVPYTICAYRLIDRDNRKPCSTIQPDEFEDFIQKYSEMGDSSGQLAILIIAWYIRTPWNDRELAERARNLAKSTILESEYRRTVHELLERLGEKLEPDS